jgi:hypothetical protein
VLPARVQEQCRLFDRKCEDIRGHYENELLKVF